DMDRIVVHDAIGRKVISIDATSSVAVDFSSLASGIYLIQVQAGRKAIGVSVKKEELLLCVPCGKKFFHNVGLIAKAEFDNPPRWLPAASGIRTCIRGARGSHDIVPRHDPGSARAAQTTNIHSTLFLFGDRYRHPPLGHRTYDRMRVDPVR